MKLTPGTRIELYERPRYSKKLMAKGWFLVEQHTADKLLLKHETRNYRECLPMFDIRAGVYHLKHDGVWMQCRKNTNWKKVLDERDKQRAGTLDALPDDETDDPIDENSPDSPTLPDVTDERNATTMMKKADILKHIADGKTIEDLIAIYHPQYPKMSIRMLRAKLMGMTAERKPKAVKQTPVTATADIAEAYVEPVAPAAPVVHPIGSERPIVLIENEAQPKRLTYCIPNNGYQSTSESFIKAIAESNGYECVEKNIPVDVCIILFPLTPRGLVELGCYSSRVRSYLVHPSDLASEHTTQLIKELSAGKELFVFDTGKVLIEQLRFLESIQTA